MFCLRIGLDCRDLVESLIPNIEKKRIFFAEKFKKFRFLEKK